MVKRVPKKSVSEMTDEEMKDEMTNMITADIMRFVETVTKKRVGLFVDEIYNGIKGSKK